MQTCSECGKEMVKGLTMHMKAKHDSPVAVAERPTPLNVLPTPPEAWMRRRGAERQLTPLEQIRRSPTRHEGAGAYFIKPDGGATIRDVLIYYPNGATTQEVGKYGENSEYYHKRQADKGLEYVGATLGELGIKRLVDVIVKNRPDEVQICSYEIQVCEFTIANTGVQKEREVASRRREQLKRRLAYLMEPLDADALIAELNDIGEAQTIARLDPATRKAMEILLSRSNSKMLALVAKLGKTPEGRKAGVGGSDPVQFAGTDFIESSPDEDA